MSIAALRDWMLRKTAWSKTRHLRTPDGYVFRDHPVLFHDEPTPITYQPHIYDFAIFLAKRKGVKKIVDIGCGSGAKLCPIQQEFELVCVDHPDAESLLKEHLPDARFIACDLEKGIINLDRIGEDAVVICADVVEHLVNPQLLLAALARLSKNVPFMLVSTPDRSRARGLLNDGPPDNPAHVREWSADEFGRLLVDNGFSKEILLGFTINNDHDLAKGTVLAVAGKESEFRRGAPLKRVAALMHCFNEVDVIEAVLTHLHQHGIETHVFDNWSTDGTFELACRLRDSGICAYVHRFPEKDDEYCDWSMMLDHTSAYAETLDVDWVIHYDADEVRLPPWRAATLQEAISFIDALGYNAIDFTVLNFLFVDRSERTVFEPSSAKFFDFGRHPAHLVQVKCWKNSSGHVDLSTSAGHDVSFAGRKVFPIKFLNKHYPLRSYDQANRKIYRDRLPRWQREKTERGWHSHYETFKSIPLIEPWKQFELTNFDPHIFDADYLVERLSGIGIETEPRAIPNIESRLHKREAEAPSLGEGSPD